MPTPTPAPIVTAQPINPWNIVILILFLGAMLVGSYFLTKRVGKKGMSGAFRRDAKGAMKRGLVSVEDRLILDRDKSITVVKFNGKHYLIGTTADDLQLLDKVRISNQEPEEESEPPQDSFVGWLKDSYANARKGKENVGKGGK